MAQPFLLERESRDVEVAGRRFRLTEMSGPELRRYIELQLQPAQLAVDQLAAAGEVRLEEAVDRMTAASDELYFFLLRDPADGGAPADAALLAQLTHRMRRKLLQLQDELNDMERIAGNAFDLLARAQARRAAGTMDSAGPS